MLNKLKFPLFVILCSLQISCTPQPPDVYVFEPLQQRLATNPVNQHLELHASPACMAKINEVECLHGVSIMTGKEVYVGELTLFNGKKASELKSESVLVPAIESYAPLSVYIINSCKKMNCNDQVDQFKIKLDSLGNVKSAIP